MIVRSIVACLFLTASTSVVTRSDTIGLHDDASGTSCNITDYFFKQVYVVHHTTGGVTGSEWAAPKPACWTNATWLSDTEPFEQIGNSQTGKAIGYGVCMAVPRAIHILTINYFVQGSSPSCCEYPLLPAPWAGGEVHVADCNNNIVVAAGLVSMINGNATCPCGYPVPVEETTWGRVKALYTD